VILQRDEAIFHTKPRRDLLHVYLPDLLGREPTPGAAIIECPSVNTHHNGGLAGLTAART
jgi:hypothetical protein